MQQQLLMSFARITAHQANKATRADAITAERLANQQIQEQMLKMVKLA